MVKAVNGNSNVAEGVGLTERFAALTSNDFIGNTGFSPSQWRQ
jgi:hypothetical protein